MKNLDIFAKEKFEALKISGMYCVDGYITDADDAKERCLSDMKNCESEEEVLSYIENFESSCVDIFSAIEELLGEKKADFLEAIEEKLKKDHLLSKELDRLGYDVK